jgi:hypothetical protein
MADCGSRGLGGFQLARPGTFIPAVRLMPGPLETNTTATENSCGIHCDAIDGDARK